MKTLIRKILMTSFLGCFSIGIGQSQLELPSQIPVAKTFSENQENHLISYAYQAEAPTLKGKTLVYRQGREIYTIDRNFDLRYGEVIILSNDGETIVYLNNAVDYYQDDTKNVSIYRAGKLVQEFDELEFTGCDTHEFVNADSLINSAPCNLFYYNKNIFEYENPKGRNRKLKLDSNGNRVLKEGLDEKELFLYKNYVISHHDTLYLTDKRKMVTLYDLNNLKIIGQKRFEEIYPQIKDKQREESQISYLEYTYNPVFNLTNQLTGNKLADIIGEISNAQIILNNDARNKEFKLYRIELGGYLNKSGLFEMEVFHCDEELNREEITEYIKNSKFNKDFIPKELEKIYLEPDVLYFRNPIDSLAKMELVQFKEQKKIDYENNQLLDSINNIYIPKDLKDSFIQLDKILYQKDQEKIKQVGTEHLHFSLGLWIRNNWGLWGGSRLEKYFRDRKPSIHPDDISAEILYQYQQWLNGNKNIAQEWEKANPVIKRTK